jgi:hypothetical protein
MTELKKCPFCACPEVELRAEGDLYGSALAWVECSSCSARGPLIERYAEEGRDAVRAEKVPILASKEWNDAPRRKPPTYGTSHLERRAENLRRQLSDAERAYPDRLIEIHARLAEISYLLGQGVPVSEQLSAEPAEATAAPSDQST